MWYLKEYNIEDTLIDTNNETVSNTQIMQKPNCDEQAVRLVYCILRIELKAKKERPAVVKIC